MKLADFTMQQINTALDGQPEKLGIWKGGSRGCQIGVGVKGGKKFQVKIHASEPKWYHTDDAINRKKAELSAATEDIERDRIQSELDTLKRAKPDRDRRDKISDQFIDMRQKLVRTLNSIGSPLIVANSDIWKEELTDRGNATFAVEATPWLDNLAVGLNDDDNLPMMFRRDLSTEQQYKIVASLADVLAKVHAKGIVHGDLKIGNTLIVQEGGEFKAALIDYDASFILDDLRRRKYDLGAWYYVIGGTYIAPEMVEFVAIAQQEEEDMYKDFDLNLITEKSDIFSLGVTIYEYFYGRADGPNYMPMIGPDGDMLTDRVYGEAITYGYKLQLPDSIPDFLFGMFNWMLAENPVDRPTAIQVRDAFASANVNLIPAQYTRCPLWDIHRDRYELTLPDGAVLSKGSIPLYRFRRPGSSITVTRKIEDLVRDGYAIDKEHPDASGRGDARPSNDPALLMQLWPQDGDGKLPTCVRRATIAGKYQMAVKGIMRYFTYEQLRAEGVICSDAEMSTPWPCDAGLKFKTSGIIRDTGLGKGPGYYKIGEGLAAKRLSTKELVNAGFATYGVDIKLHPSDEAQYAPNPSAVPSDIANIYPDPLCVHRYIVFTIDKRVSKMMIDELETKGYVRVK